MSIDAAKEIEKLQSERSDLVNRLLVPGLSGEEKHDISQRIVAIDNQITMWGGLLQQQAPRKRKEREAWRLMVTVTRGASMQHFRQRVYQLADKCCGYGGRISYESPVTGNSDLIVELYFTTELQALQMESVIREAVRDRWRSVTMPLSEVTDVSNSVDITTLKRIFADHYDRRESPRDRVKFDMDEVEERSARTTVLDDEEIDKESVVDRHMTALKFEKCHIDASIKGTKDDTTGNHIPLTSDWHDYFDGYTCDKIAAISIAPAKKGTECLGAVGKDGRQEVKVHVYFNATNPFAPHLSATLRSATLVRPNVWEVTIFKKEAARFVDLLQARHDTVVAQWNSIP